MWRDHTPCTQNTRAHTHTHKLQKAGMTEIILPFSTLLLTFDLHRFFLVWRTMSVAIFHPSHFLSIVVFTYIFSISDVNCSLLSNVNLTFSLNWLYKLLPCWHPVCWFLLPFWTWNAGSRHHLWIYWFQWQILHESGSRMLGNVLLDVKLSGFWKRLKKYVCFLIKCYHFWRLLVWFFNVQSAWPRRKQATYLISVFCVHNS